MELFNAGHIPNQEAHIYLMSDLHLGCHQWAEAQFMHDSRAIIMDPYARVILHGDTLQYDLAQSVGDTYTQTIPPGQQKYVAERLLSPFAKKIIGMCRGNHENRSKEDANPILDLAKFLGVHYFDDECSFRISVGKDKYGNPAVWSFYGLHGSSNGQTIGSITNSLYRMSGICDADVYFMGHSHYATQFNNVFFRRDIIHGSMVPVVRTYVCSASYQGREKYSTMKGMIPKTMGCPVLTLNADLKRISVDLPTGIRV
jgi:hypothetical protein